MAFKRLGRSLGKSLQREVLILSAHADPEYVEQVVLLAGGI
jgi:hypothetical protein